MLKFDFLEINMVAVLVSLLYFHYFCNELQKNFHRIHRETVIKFLNGT